MVQRLHDIQQSHIDEGNRFCDTELEWQDREQEGYIEELTVALRNHDFASVAHEVAATLRDQKVEFSKESTF